MQDQDNSSAIFRLTALWALCETGLGGFMHALHLPFTGFFVGAFAVIIICLIGWYSHFSFKTLINATLMVVLAKALVSPQSPFPAYIAVGFQGVIGAIIFSVIPYFRFSCILIGLLAMIESAAQQLIITTLIFGKSFFTALDLFFNRIVGEIHLPKDTSFSMWVVGVYISLYALWGILIGFWASRLPSIITKNETEILAKIAKNAPQLPASQPKKNNRNRKFGTYIIMLLTLAMLIWWDGGNTHKAMYIIIRSLMVVLVLIMIVNPLVKWLITKLAHRKSNSQLQNIVATQPYLSSMLKPAYQLANEKYKGINKYKFFIIVMIVLGLNGKID